MEKKKYYRNCHFSADVIKDVLIGCTASSTKNRFAYKIERGDETWEYDDDKEFFADYRKAHWSSTVRILNEKFEVSIYFFRKTRHTSITVKAGTRGEIEGIFEIFEKAFPNSILPLNKEANNQIVFIGHGSSNQWRDLKDHLADKHGYKIEAYETGARAGHTIRDILDQMAVKSSIAFLVMTGDDVSIDGSVRARQNVVHEIGLFQGRLGFSRAVAFLEDGVEEFSNLHGIQQIRFSKNNIKETFGEVLATLKREFEL